MASQEPVFAFGLLSPTGVPFVLVREAVGVERRTLAWLIWRDSACVGYVGATLPPADPFVGGAALTTRRSLNVFRSVAIWRSDMVAGSGDGTGAPVLARIASRGLGIMSTAYPEIIRQLSVHGWALRSNPKARNRDAKRLWSRLRATRGLEIVRSRVAFGELREYAFMLAASLSAVRT